VTIIHHIKIMPDTVHRLQDVSRLLSTSVPSYIATKFDNRFHLVNTKYTSINYKEHTICKLGTVSELPCSEQRKSFSPHGWIKFAKT